MYFENLLGVEKDEKLREDIIEQRDSIKGIFYFLFTEISSYINVLWLSSLSVL